MKSVATQAERGERENDLTPLRHARTLADKWRESLDKKKGGYVQTVITNKKS